ncbi:MAG TPA: hypothetical protein DDZ89_03035 [Clostridiales bacterium]|nr:hypothetical protein [Clostridiales bacterium]
MEIDMKIKMGPICFPGIYELDQGLRIEIHENNRIYGRLNDVYISLIGKNELKFSEKDQSDLIQDGKETF